MNQLFNSNISIPDISFNIEPKVLFLLAVIIGLFLLIGFVKTAFKILLICIIIAIGFYISTQSKSTFRVQVNDLIPTRLEQNIGGVSLR